MMPAMRRVVLALVVLAACGGGGGGDTDSGGGGGGDDDGDGGGAGQDARPNDGNVGDGAPSVPGSLRFFGTGTGGIDRVEIAVDPAVPADVGLGDFTIDFWVRPNRTGGFGFVETCSTGTSGLVGGNVVIDRDRTGNGDHGEFRVAITGGPTASAGGAAVGVGKGATGAMALYVDGNPDGTATGPTGDISYRDGATGAPEDRFLVFGAEKHDASTPSFNGWMDEVRISTTIRYPAAFTLETVPYAAADADTAALYHFDEGDGAALGDTRSMSPGVIKVGSTPTGTVPVWASATPFLQ
jgi:hypothetical protein